MKYLDYAIEEEYNGEKIEVFVREYWMNGKIVRADVSCPKYSALSRTLGNKGNRYLSVSDVSNAILKEVMIAEKTIDFKNRSYYNNLHRCRFNVVVNYMDEKIVVSVGLSSNSDKASIFCEYDPRYKTFTMRDNVYRDAIINEVRNAKHRIDSGYSLNVFRKIKRKVKSLF